MKSYETTEHHKHVLKFNNSKEGEPIEIKVERLVNNKEPIKDGSPLIYQERQEGVKKQYNIRTDRFEVAIDATDKIAKSYKARREERAKNKADTRAEGSQDGKPESTHGKVDPTTESPK